MRSETKTDYRHGVNDYSFVTDEERVRRTTFLADLVEILQQEGVK